VRGVCMHAPPAALKIIEEHRWTWLQPSS
jgi:hypothetical protein